jgi:hypothetical protein
MSMTLQFEGPTDTTILNYPGFQALPKGIKQMLVASEAHFFDQPASHHQERQRVTQEMSANRGFKVLIPHGTKWRNLNPSRDSTSERITMAF